MKPKTVIKHLFKDKHPDYIKELSTALMYGYLDLRDSYIMDLNCEITVEQLRALKTMEEMYKAANDYFLAPFKEQNPELYAKVVKEIKRENKEFYPFIPKWKIKDN